MPPSIDFIYSELRNVIHDDKLKSVFIGFNKHHYDDSLFSLLSIHFPDNFTFMTKKRKAEFLAGRYCAKIALSQLDIDNYCVKNAPDRSPCWPLAISASISHSAHYAIAFAAKKQHYKFIGVDIEKYLSERDIPNLYNLVLSHCEQDYIKQFPLPLSVSLALSFSIKESVYKAIYPHVGHCFDFYAVNIVNINLEQQTIELRLAENLSETHLKGYKMCGKFILFHTFLISYFVQ